MVKRLPNEAFKLLVEKLPEQMKNLDQLSVGVNVGSGTVPGQPQENNCYFFSSAFQLVSDQYKKDIKAANEQAKSDDDWTNYKKLTLEFSKVLAALAKPTKDGSVNLDDSLSVENRRAGLRTLFYKTERKNGRTGWL